jgi:hypothetical protein
MKRQWYLHTNFAFCSFVKEFMISNNFSLHIVGFLGIGSYYLQIEIPWFLLSLFKTFLFPALSHCSGQVLKNYIE